MSYTMAGPSVKWKCGPCMKKWFRISRWQQQSIKPIAGPFELQLHRLHHAQILLNCGCTGCTMRRSFWTVAAQVSSPWSQCYCSVSFTFPFLFCSLEILFKAVSLDSHRDCLLCFLSLRNHSCPFWPGVQSLENCCLILFCFVLVVSSKRINPFPVSPSWLEAGVIFSVKIW